MRFELAAAGVPQRKSTAKPHFEKKQLVGGKGKGKRRR
jgi:hypothetical protein